MSALVGVHPDYSKVEKYLNDDSFENNLRAYIKEGDILFTTVGSIGLVSLMDAREEAAIAQNIVAFRANKRRNSKTGRKSLFSGLVFCSDCGAKLHFCAAKSLKKDQEFFRCSNYKDGRGEYSIHFIRDIVLEAIVKEAISELADFVGC